MILVLGDAVVNLDRQVIDERLRPGRNVLLEQSIQGAVQGCADEVATCIDPSREHSDIM